MVHGIEAILPFLPRLLCWSELDCLGIPCFVATPQPRELPSYFSTNYAWNCASKSTLLALCSFWYVPTVSTGIMGRYEYK